MVNPLVPRYSYTCSEIDHSCLSIGGKKLKREVIRNMRRTRDEQCVMKTGVYYVQCGRGHSFGLYCD